MISVTVSQFVCLSICWSVCRSVGWLVSGSIGLFEANIIFFYNNSRAVRSILKSNWLFKTPLIIHEMNKNKITHSKIRQYCMKSRLGVTKQNNQVFERYILIYMILCLCEIFYNKPEGKRVSFPFLS